MKILMQVWLIAMWTLSVSADWTLGTIYNNSDLILDQAWRYSSSGKTRTLSSFTKLLQNSYAKHRTSIVVKYHISSQGVALRARDGKGHEVDIFLDGQPTHSIEWKRKKTQKITQFPQSCAVSDGAFCARVLVQDVADGKSVADPVAVPHDTSMTFSLTITGTQGSYQVTLQEA